MRNSRFIEAFNGVQLAESEKQNNLNKILKNGLQKRKHIKWYGIFAAALVLAVFFGSVKFSPAFAELLSNVPALDQVVGIVTGTKPKNSGIKPKLVLHGREPDKGLKIAVDNKHAKPVNFKYEQNGISFSIDNVIVDKTALVVFYTLDVDEEKYAGMDIRASILLKNTDGEDIWTGMGGLRNGYKFSFPKSDNFEVPRKLLLSVKFYNSDVFGKYGANSKEKLDTLEVILEIDDSVLNCEREFVINKTIEVAGQRMTFERITVFPTQAILDISYDEKNSAKIFSLQNLTLVDENGTTWNRIGTLPTTNYIDTPIDNKIKVRFESFYYTMPKELYIKGTGFRALDKDKLDVVIDVDNARLVKAPDDRLRLDSLNIDDKQLLFSLTIDKEARAKDWFYLFLTDGVDENGEKIGQVLGSSGSGGDQHNTINAKIGLDKPLKGLVTFQVYDYPSYVDEEFEVHVPLTEQ